MFVSGGPKAGVTQVAIYPIPPSRLTPNPPSRSTSTPPSHTSCTPPSAASPTSTPGTSAPTSTPPSQSTNPVHVLTPQTKTNERTKNFASTLIYAGVCLPLVITYAFFLFAHLKSKKLSTHSSGRNRLPLQPRSSRPSKRTCNGHNHHPSRPQLYRPQRCVLSLLSFHLIHPSHFRCHWLRILQPHFPCPPHCLRIKTL